MSYSVYRLPVCRCQRQNMDNLLCLRPVVLFPEDSVCSSYRLSLVFKILMCSEYKYGSIFSLVIISSYNISIWWSKLHIIRLGYVIFPIINIKKCQAVCSLGFKICLFKNVQCNRLHTVQPVFIWKDWFYIGLFDNQELLIFCSDFILKYILFYWMVSWWKSFILKSKYNRVELRKDYNFNNYLIGYCE